MRRVPGCAGGSRCSSKLSNVSTLAFVEGAGEELTFSQVLETTLPAVVVLGSSTGGLEQSPPLVPRRAGGSANSEGTL